MIVYKSLLNDCHSRPDRESRTLYICDTCWIPAPRFHEDKFRGNDKKRLITVLFTKLA